MRKLRRQIYGTQKTKKTANRSWRAALTMAVLVVTMSVLTMFSFAATEDGAAITSDMLSPVLDAVKDNIAVIVPVAIGLFAIMLGIALIPRLFKKFTNH